MIRVLLLLVLAATAIVLLTVTESATEAALREQALVKAERACNDHLPGANWSVANRSVNLSATDAQELICTRNGTARSINVSIEVEVAT